MKKTEVIRKKPQDEVPCRKGCPAGIDIPKFIRLSDQGKFEEALAVVLENNPFPSVTGHVCPALCESKCRRGEIDSPVAINALERFVSEQSRGSVSKEKVKAERLGKRVAVIGSGPAGLTAAYYLAKFGGHDVTVFEALPKPGGSMRAGIPDYRLPKDVLDAEIERITDIGVKIKTNKKIESIDMFFQEGWSAVFLAVGTHRSIKMGIEGEDIPGVLDGLEFLKGVSLGRKDYLGEKVVVIGGGNVAVDSARTAIRLGSKEVKIVYRRTRAEMPASLGEVEEAIQEGVEIVFSIMPKSISKTNGKLRLNCVRVELGTPNASGNRRLIPVEGSESYMDTNSIIVAVGTIPDIPSTFNLKVGKENTVQVDAETLATYREGVYAGGDMVSGAASVVEAIALGRKAAIAMDKYLGGKGVMGKSEPSSDGTMNWVGFEEDILDIGRLPVPTLPVKERIDNFAEVKLGFSKEMAKREINRCLHCDQSILLEVDIDRCTNCYTCQLICSLVYEGVCNPEKARILIGGDEINYSSECVASCSLCIQHCPQDALLLKG